MSRSKGIGFDVNVISGMNLSAKSVVPVVVAAVVTGGATLAIRYLVKNKTVKRVAPLLGAVAGAVASVPLAAYAGKDGARNGVLTAVAVGGGQQAYEEVSKLVAKKTGKVSGLVAESLSGLTAEEIAGLVAENVGELDVISGMPNVPEGDEELPGEYVSSFDDNAFGTQLF